MGEDEPEADERTREGDSTADGPHGRRAAAPQAQRPGPLPLPDPDTAAAAEQLGGRLPDAPMAVEGARAGIVHGADADAAAAVVAAVLPYSYYQSGTARARLEVFERRGRLTRELTQLGLPPVYEHMQGTAVMHCVTPVRGVASVDILHLTWRIDFCTT